MSDENFQLIQQYLDGSLAEADVAKLQRLLLADAEARATLRTMATLDLGLSDIAVSQIQSNEKKPNETRSVPPARTASRLSASWTRSLLAIASLAIIGLGAALWFQSGSSAKPAADRKIARVTGTGGEIVWTGNGGSVETNLEPGTVLTGGTIEGTSPTSWVELEFLDGSRVTVAGDSRLTFSDFGQKLLYLKKGNVSSSVEPQMPNAPMLVYTRNAMLEVLGTEFKLESEVDATSLNVTEGKVRFKQLSDGQTVEVPANQRVRTSDGAGLTTQPIPRRTSQWKSNLNQPYGTHGKWLPGSDLMPPRLRLIHYSHKTPEGESILIKNAGMSVLGENSERVDLSAGSKIRFRGYAKENQKAVFGVVVRDGKGDFAGYYTAAQPKTHWMNLQTEEDSDGQSEGASGLKPFEVVIDVADLSLGVDLKHQGFADSPAGLVVDWAFGSAPAEESDFEIAEIEIFRPDNFNVESDEESLDDLAEPKDSSEPEYTVEQVMGFLDKNGDEKISKEEAKASPQLAPAFGMVDTNKDGFIDVSEAKAMLEYSKNQNAPQSSDGGMKKDSKNRITAKQVIASMDKNKDGKIAKREADAELKLFFDDFDSSKDGFIDEKEGRAIADEVNKRQ
jgi:ferric-dicitrate binding protein FerR (iron transport regulator)/Ca2+-binding EF-hand superfamily protein